MNRLGFLEIVNRVHDRLKEWHDLFEVGHLISQPPVDNSCLMQIEGELGFRMPRALRSVYMKDCASLTFSWRLPEESAARLGYEVPNPDPDKAFLEGYLELLSPDRVVSDYLEICSIQRDDLAAIDGVVPIMRAEREGNWYCLDFAQQEGYKVPIIGLMRGQPPNRELVAADLVQFIRTWSAIGFVQRMELIIIRGLPCDDPLFRPLKNLLTNP